MKLPLGLRKNPKKRHMDLSRLYMPVQNIDIITFHHYISSLCRGHLVIDRDKISAARCQLVSLIIT